MDLTDFSWIFFNGVESNGHKKVKEEQIMEVTFEKNKQLTINGSFFLKVTLHNYGKNNTIICWHDAQTILLFADTVTKQYHNTRTQCINNTIIRRYVAETIPLYTDTLSTQYSTILGKHVLYSVHIRWTFNFDCLSLPLTH